LNSTGAAVTNQTGSFTVKQQDNAYSDFTLLRFGATLPTDGDSIQINGLTYTFDMDGANALPSATPTIKLATAQVEELTVSGDVNTGDTFTVNLDGAGLLTYTVLASDTTVTDIATGIAAMINANAANAAVATASVSGTGKITLTATEAQRGRAISAVIANPVDPSTGSNFTQATLTANVAPALIDTTAKLMTAMNASIEGNDSVLATTGNRIQTFDLNNDGNAETLYIATVTNNANNVVTTGMTTASVPTDGDGTAYASSTIPVATASGIVFSSGGAPSAFNVGALEILGFADGAQDMNDATGQGKRITLDFGTLNEFNGLTQFGEEFTPAFITQNGSKFGTFAGVTIGQDGLVTALFDNGETRKIFQVPVATFVNPNQLENKSGNVWSATQFSGDYTLRVADSGPAGQVVQGTLESSTVDIGAEFTNMMVQRAYSASTKIISTADAMLEELMRVKR
jgi:flagellar hook protein FlgE